MNTTEPIDILDVIESISSTEWRKRTGRIVSYLEGPQFITVDQSHIPPTVHFRFEIEDPRVVALLQEAVQSYEGLIPWAMVGRQRELLSGTNWVICPKRMIEVKALAEQSRITAAQYLAATDPSFGPVAHDDLIGLTAHIERLIDARRSE
ncbi:hypothetical protein [Eleftheria terrae]|uniref:hypothetical protein n=1 Tax=Eleftheria terrae TaxID=1597781 RepID=UPI00263AD322|nr:hypothetical protein [Eleftheria terrae]WKB56083.1 hypothetical protein N7L95_28915 [Eleftheria terrae]